MALILSAASGNFNAGATWVGGIVPGAADEARASTGHTITITANVTCTELSNAGTGLYILNSGVTLTANVTHKSATTNVNCLQFTAASPATATIVGNITGGGAASTTVFGAVNNTSSGALTITGNVTGGSASLAIGVNNNSTGTITITGNVTGGSSSSAYGAGNSTGTITITGNVTGGNNASAIGVNNNSTGTITIIGNVTGGTNSSAHGVSNTSTGPATITGNITAATAHGVSNTSTATLTISGGTYTASNTANAVSSTNASSVVRVSGSFIYASNGFVPINTPKFILLSTPTLAKTRYALNGSTTYVDMFTADNSLGQAAITDVRLGTVYASGILTGTLAVPPAGSVALGVPVDNTTGTATLTAANVRSAIGLATANLDTQLADLPTAAENADAVWDEATSGHTTAGTYGGRVVRSTNANNELQINAQHHVSANVHQFQAEVITSSAFDASVITAFAVPELQEIHAIHGLKTGDTLTVTPTSRTAGAISQTIGGDGTTTTTVSRD